MGSYLNSIQRGADYRPEDEIAELHRLMEETQGELRFFREQVASMDRALEAARLAPPGPEFAKLLGPLPQCPTCGAGAVWRSRSCCPLGQLIGQVEGQAVAEVLMQRDA